VSDFIKAFVRDPDGSWTCVAPATWEGPPRVQVTIGLRFMPGTFFMGLDLARLLDEQHERDRNLR
jgi:hypothetical protein